MKRSVLLTGILAVTLFVSVTAKAQKTKQGKKGQELPDVALVIPDDTRPEVRAIIKENVINLRSKKASERRKAAEVLGELKEAGKPVRGLLCLTMLDSSPMVRVAAADALKAVDRQTFRLALELMENNGDVRGALSGTILKLGEDGEPLAPLVAYYALQSGGLQEADLQRRIAERLNNKQEIHSLTSSNDTLGPQLTVLARIAGKDLAACKLIASALSNPDPGVRRVAIDLLAEMKHGALAVSKIIRLLKSDNDDNRLAAIKTLVALADKSTEEIITAAITDQRLDKNGKVRDAVDDALNKLQNK